MQPLFLRAALVLSTSGLIVNALAPHATPISTPASTTQAAALAQRDALPTITLGPATNYADPPSKSPTITNVLSLVPRSQPIDGIDVYLGPNLQKSISAIFAQICPQTYNSGCESRVTAALNPQEFGLQARQLGRPLRTLRKGALYIVALALYRGWRDRSVTAPNIQSISHVHLPGSDIAQASSLESSNTIVLATTANDANLITITISDDPDATTNAPTVSTASAAGNGYGRGDVIITLPQKLGSQVVDLINVHSGCTNGKPAGQVGLDCIESIASSGVMAQAAQNGPIRALALFWSDLPAFSDGAIASTLSKLIAGATESIPLLALKEDGINFLAEIAFWIVYEHVVKRDPTQTQWIIPASMTLNGAAPSSTSCDPIPENIPECSNCGGTQENHAKQDSVCPGPQWKGCPCVDGPSYPNIPFDSLADLLAAQKVLKNIHSSERPVSPTSASPTSAPPTSGPPKATSCPDPHLPLGHVICDTACPNGWGNCGNGKSLGADKSICLCNAPCVKSLCGNPAYMS